MCTLFDRATVEGHLARRADALAVHLEVLAGKAEAARAVAPPGVRGGAEGLAAGARRPGWQMAADRDRYRRLLHL